MCKKLIALLAVGFANHIDDEGIVRNSVNDVCGQNWVGKDGFPFVKRNVSSNNSAFAFSSHRKMREKEFARFAVE